MSEKRFRRMRLGYSKEGIETVTSVAVIATPVGSYNALLESEREAARLIDIKVGGMISELLALTWAGQICDQLNQFDVANAAVAKLT